MFKLIEEAIDDILWPLVFVVFFWLAFFANQAYPFDLNSFGIEPRSFRGLRGVIFSPFLHGSFGHLFSNTIPFIVSGSFVFHFFKQMSWKIFGLIWFVSGFGVWLIGQSDSIHIGASGMVYGLVGFLLTSGIIRRNRALSAVALILIFLYGSMVWGVLPQISLVGEKISWEGHLFGLLSGVILAWHYRAQGPQDESVEVEKDEDMPLWWLAMQEEERRQHEEMERQNSEDRIVDPNPTIIRYRYKPNDDEQNQ